MSTVSFFVDKKGEGKKRRREAREQKPQDEGDGAAEEVQAVEDESEAPRPPVSKKAKQLGWKKRAKKQKRANKATAAVMAGEEGEEEERALEDDLFGDDMRRQAAATVSRKRAADQDSEAEEEDEIDAVKEEEEEEEDEESIIKKEDEEEDESSSSEDEEAEKERRRALEEKERMKKAKKAAEQEQKAAWVDEDDEEQQIELTRRKAVLLTRKELAELEKTGGKKVVSGNEYQRRLRHHAAAIRDAFVSSGVAARAVSWATAAPPSTTGKAAGAEALEEGADDDVAALLRSTSHSTSSTGGAAAPQRPVYINVSRLRDANASVQGTTAITGAACAMQFHPRRPQLLMVATAADSCVRLFDVDGERNSMVAEARLRRLQLEGACMLGPDPTEIVAVGTQPFFYVYDIASSTVSKVSRVIGRSERAYPRIAASPTGEYVVLHGGGGGEGVVLSGRTKQLVGTVRLSSALMTSAVFSAADPNVLYASGAGGDVFAFDMRMMMRCVQRFSFSGASNTTSLAVAPVPALSTAATPADRYMAVGSDSGVVDVFTGDEVRKASTSRMPVAAKSLMNLTTAADGAVFNPDAQLLAVWSRRKQRAFKLVHLPSCTVFSNWPQTTAPLGTVYSAAFSPNGGYLALGNEQGRALLFRMCHWPRA